MISVTEQSIDLSENSNGDSGRSLPSEISSQGEQVSLDKQKFEQRKILFRWVPIVCGASYLLFLISFCAIVFSDAYFIAFLAHKHIAIFMLSLLIMPSFLLWGLLRAVYAPESYDDDIKDLIKTIKATHPASNVGSNIV